MSEQVSGLNSVVLNLSTSGMPVAHRLKVARLGYFKVSPSVSLLWQFLAIDICGDTSVKRARNFCLLPGKIASVVALAFCARNTQDSSHVVLIARTHWKL